MRFILLMIAAGALALGILTACTNTAAPLKASNNTAATPATDARADDAPRISLADAKKDFDDGTAIFVDTRAEISYQQEHVTGSINLPMEAFEQRYKELPTGKKIIAYCS